MLALKWSTAWSREGALCEDKNKENCSSKTRIKSKVSQIKRPRDTKGKQKEVSRHWNNRRRPPSNTRGKNGDVLVFTNKQTPSSTRGLSPPHDKKSVSLFVAPLTFLSVDINGTPNGEKMSETVRSLRQRDSNKTRERHAERERHVGAETKRLGLSLPAATTTSFSNYRAKTERTSADTTALQSNTHPATDSHIKHHFNFLIN